MTDFFGRPSYGYPHAPDFRTVRIEVSLSGQPMRARLVLPLREATGLTKTGIFEKLKRLISASVRDKTVDRWTGNASYRIMISVDSMELGRVVLTVPSHIGPPPMGSFSLSSLRSDMSAFTIHLEELLRNSLSIRADEPFLDDKVPTCPCGTPECPYDPYEWEPRGGQQSVSRFSTPPPSDRYIKELLLNKMEEQLAKNMKELLSLPAEPVDLSSAQEVGGRDVASMGREVSEGAREVDGWNTT